ncbi:helix-turn-helix domain-containing protein [Streptomyces sp. NPDC002917]|uniref:AlbA family DNA-binding domain-containing protein n=1 Tax=Streptomyces sp. NPDC002917 TaxID=3364671 RepID=UPI003699861B
MTLNVPLDRPFRSPVQLKELVSAVKNGGEHDESDWIEWKSTYDLTSKEVRATLARHIIAMANRAVGKSSTIAGGYGYIIVGAEAGNIEGVSTVDLADLESGIRPYLGHQGPEWTATYVILDSRNILVLAVEPPKNGDPIFTLHRAFDKYIPGMIFVRRMAQTVQAGPGEVLELTSRATVSRRRQDLMLNASKDPVVLPTWSGLDELIEKRKEARFADCMRPATPSPKGSLPFSQQPMDHRSKATYRREVEEHVTKYGTYLRDIALQRYINENYGQLKLRIVNSDHINHQSVRVELAFPNWLIALSADDYLDREIIPPRRPTPLGEGMAISSIIGDYSQTLYTGPRDFDLRLEEGRATFNVSSVRAEEIVELPCLNFIAHSRKEDTQGISWSITSLNSDGRSRGSFQLSFEGALTSQVSP